MSCELRRRVVRLHCLPRHEGDSRGWEKHKVNRPTRATPVVRSFSRIENPEWRIHAHYAMLPLSKYRNGARGPPGFLFSSP
jgi:hypothetical protein